MTSVTHEHELATFMTPLIHLLAILQPPLARLLYQTQKQRQPRIPALKSLPHFLQIRLRRVHQLWQVVRTSQNDVVQPATLEEVADYMRVWSHPVVDRRMLHELTERVVLLHVLSFHDNPIRQISREMRRMRMPQHLLSTNRLQAIRANDHVRVLIYTSIGHRKRRRIEIDGPYGFAEQNLDSEGSGLFDKDAMEIGTVDVIVRCAETFFIAWDEVDARQSFTVSV